jgi:RecA-family ATPase
MKNSKKNENDKRLKTEKPLSIMELIKKSKSEPAPQIVWRGITKGSFGFIFGPSKSGKTILCENLAMKLAIGSKQYLGEELMLIPQKVLFVSLEEFWVSRARRNAKQIEIFDIASKKVLEKNYQSVPEDFLRYLDNGEDWSRFINIIKESKSEIVFVDSLTRLASNIEESETAKRVTQKLREITHDLGITMIVIHHSTKIGDKPISRDSMAGSRVLAQEADFAIAVTRTQLNDRYIKNIFFRYADDFTETVTKFKINEKLWIDYTEEIQEYMLYRELDGRTDSSNADMILEFIKSNSCTTSSVLERTFVANSTMGRKTLFNNLKKLQTQNLIDNNKGNYCFREKSIGV